MGKTIDWNDIYLDKCMENKDLRKEIRILQEILRNYLPVLTRTQSDNTGNNN
jgi:hypothetical protein